MPTLSVIIPTRNAAKEIGTLLIKLFEQSYPIQELIVVDSESSDDTTKICKNFDSVRLIEIKKSEFDHGKTRDMAFRQSTGDVVIFMTQDAVPANKDFISNLIKPLSDDKVAVSTGRQLPKSDASKMEELIRLFNYPDKSSIRSASDIPTMGIKAFFCSDVCAAYKRDIYLDLGGFDYPIKTNEDMFFAAKVLSSGYCVAYAADAEVFHSHNFTLKQQYDRNFIQGYEIEKHKELLNNAPDVSAGKKLVKHVSSGLLKHGRIFSFIHFGFDCIARFTGNRAGKKKARKEV
jgi:Glycosyltransferases, probably involved in cell wall biogenesis